MKHEFRKGKGATPVLFASASQMEEPSFAPLDLNIFAPAGWTHRKGRISPFPEMRLNRKNAKAKSSCSELCCCFVGFLFLLPPRVGDPKESSLGKLSWSRCLVRVALTPQGRPGFAPQVASAHRPRRDPQADEMLGKARVTSSQSLKNMVCPWRK